MGYMTIIKILNDGWREVEKNPKKLVQEINRLMNGDYTSNKNRRCNDANIGCGNPVSVYKSFHADDIKVFFAGQNSLISTEDINDYIKTKPKLAANVLSSILSNVDYTIQQVQKELIKGLEENFDVNQYKNEEEIKTFFTNYLMNNELYKEMSNYFATQSILKKNSLYNKFKSKVCQKYYVLDFETLLKLNNNNLVINYGYVTCNKYFMYFKEAESFLLNSIKETGEYSKVEQCYVITEKNSMVALETSKSITEIRKLALKMIEK